MRSPALVLMTVLSSSGCHMRGASPLVDAPASNHPGMSITESSVAEKSQPLVLHCECAETDQDRLLKELTAERVAIAQRLSLPDAATPLHIHLFADHAAYRQHVSASYPQFPARRAIFVENDEHLSVFAHCGDHLAEDLRHEAAHGFLHAAVPNLPLWLDEGLAEYFEVGRGKRGLNLSHIDLLRGQQAVGSWRPDLARLEQLHDGGAMTQLEYAEAWLWVHFLLESPGDKSEVLIVYLADLRSGVADEPLSARLGRRLASPQPALLEHLDALLP